MKKALAAISTATTYLYVTVSVYAAVGADTTEKPTNQFQLGVSPPSQGINPGTSLGTIISNVLTIIFAVATLMVLFMLVIGAFNWITSAGDKEKIKSSRDRIINALIGLAILALAFLIVRVVGNLVNIDLLNLTLPALGPSSGPGAGTPTAIPPTNKI